MFLTSAQNKIFNLNQEFSVISVIPACPEKFSPVLAAIVTTGQAGPTPELQPWYTPVYQLQIGSQQTVTGEHWNSLTGHLTLL